LDQARGARVLDQLFSALNGSAFALFVSMGHKTGLIRTMIGLSPATSAQIADAAKLPRAMRA
jgi:hypothetical protein